MDFLIIFAWLILIASIFGTLALVLNDELRKYAKYTSIIILIALAGVITTGGLVQVPAGNRGVVLEWGAVTQKTLDEGLHWITPIAQSKIDLTVQTHAYSAEAAAASHDLQDVMTSVTVNYHLDENKVNSIYQTLRLDYEERVIKPSVQEAVKSVTAKYLAEELITKREDLKIAITQALKDRVNSFGILVETVSLTNFQFSASFTHAIEAKVAAAQQALEAENKLRQIEVEARQAEQSAKGRAAAAIAESEGQAKAIITVADATAKANDTVNKSLTPAVLQYMYINKLNPNASVVYVPSDASIIVGQAK